MKTAILTILILIFSLPASAYRDDCDNYGDCQYYDYYNSGRESPEAEFSRHKIEFQQQEIINQQREILENQRRLQEQLKNQR